MKKTNTLYFIASMVIVVIIILSSCNKSTSIESDLGDQNISLYLTDAPGVFDKVFVDIKAVKVLVDTGKDTRKRDTCNWDRAGSKPSHNEASLVWSSLDVKAGIYDILRLRNGLDTLFATSSIPKGSIRLIRIEIGTNNSVVKDSINYPLQWPANMPNYILIKLKGEEPDEFLPRKLRLWLDFDINRSIIQERNNQFYLRPCIKFFTVKSTASVYGKIVPKEAQAVVTIFNTTDTAYALPNPEGYFKIRGLKEGKYKVFVNASNGYADTTINNIELSKTKELSLGIITLKK